jgi:hypothetical protein
MLTPSPNPEAKTSGNVLKWLGIGCGSLLLLAIAGMVGMFFVAKQFLNFSFDGPKAEQMANSMMDYKLPGGSQGVMSMNISGMEIAGVMSTSTPGEAMLIVGRIPPVMESSAAEMQKSFQTSFEERQGANFQVKSTRTETRQLCGQSVTLTISEGEQMASGNGPTPAFTYQTSVNHNSNLLFVALTTTGSNAKTIADQVFSSLNCK